MSGQRMARHALRMTHGERIVGERIVAAVPAQAGTGIPGSPLAREYDE